MKKKFLALTMAVFICQAAFVFAQENVCFNTHLHWGMSAAEVIAADPVMANVSLEDTPYDSWKMLYTSIEMHGNTVYVQYSFLSDRLFQKAYIGFTRDSVNNKSYIELYNSFKDCQVKNYGEPDRNLNNEQQWQTTESESSALSLKPFGPEGIIFQATTESNAIMAEFGTYLSEFHRTYLKKDNCEDGKSIGCE